MNLLRVSPSTLSFAVSSSNASGTGDSPRKNADCGPPSDSLNNLISHITVTNISPTPVAFKWKTNRRNTYQVHPPCAVLTPDTNIMCRFIVQPLSDLDIYARGDCAPSSNTGPLCPDDRALQRTRKRLKGAFRLYLLACPPDTTVARLPADLGRNGTPYIPVPTLLAVCKQPAPATASSGISDGVKRALTRDSLVEGGEHFAHDDVLGDPHSGCDDFDGDDKDDDGDDGDDDDDDDDDADGITPLTSRHRRPTGKNSVPRKSGLSCTSDTLVRKLCSIKNGRMRSTHSHTFSSQRPKRTSDESVRGRVWNFFALCRRRSSSHTRSGRTRTRSPL